MSARSLAVTAIFEGAAVAEDGRSVRPLDGTPEEMSIRHRQSTGSVADAPGPDG